MTTLKNNLLLQALSGEPLSRPPVWMMRQAGRYLPQFRAIREKYDFFTCCRIPEIAAELTVQPIDLIGVDAAILFSDILVVPQAMGVEITLEEAVGPKLKSPLRTSSDIKNIHIPDVSLELAYVYEAISLTKRVLANRVPLIGFAGSPWTIFCYLIEGEHSRNFETAKTFCFQYPTLAHELLQKITETTIPYLKNQVKAGVDAIQIFDSWGGLFSPSDYFKFSWPYVEQIVSELAYYTKVILFAKGCWFAYEKMSRSGVAAIGVDWVCDPHNARKFAGDRVTLQGNFDPTRLLAPLESIEIAAREMIDAFGVDKYIVNLGHGILPNTPVEHAKAFVETVKSYTNTLT